MDVCRLGYADASFDAVVAQFLITLVPDPEAALSEFLRVVRPGGEIVLAGFYSDPLSFNFAPAFMREATVRAAAEWQRPDLLAVKELAETGRLSLAGLITHHDEAAHAANAYRTAFGDVACLKMVLDWTH